LLKATRTGELVKVQYDPLLDPSSQILVFEIISLEILQVVTWWGERAEEEGGGKERKEKKRREKEGFLFEDSIQRTCDKGECSVSNDSSSDRLFRQRGYFGCGEIQREIEGGNAQ
jgi:hypothetical protein